MSILTDHTAPTQSPEGGFDLLASREYVAPRANLLPPEIAERLALRRLTAAMIAAALACGGVVGALYVSQQSGRAPARAALAQVQAQHDTLAAQQSALAPSQVAHEKVLAAKKSLVAAVGSEVLWSDQFNTLRANLTDGVRLSSLAVTEASGTTTGVAGAPVTLPASPAGAGSTATTATPAGTAAPATGIATVNMLGRALSNYDLANWMDTLSDKRKFPAWSGVYLTTSTTDPVGGLVSYTITANITDVAFSHRYTNGS